VESELGQGSLFRIELPVLKLDRMEIARSYGTQRGRVTGLQPGQPEYRVLIIEDQRENWLLLEGYLQNAGFHVQVAEDAGTGIEKFVSWRPHFIWMDWRLPGMDGLEASRSIRALDGGRDVKIAMLSAFAFTEDREKALAAGVDDFVSKPFRADEVLNCLARHLGVRYTYEAATTQPGPGPIPHEAIGALSSELRKELTNAITSLDIDRIAAVIDRISEQNDELGRVLSQYAEKLAYSPILEAVQYTEGWALRRN
jgi:CheY-like chemotaxis protein